MLKRGKIGHLDHILGAVDPGFDPKSADFGSKWGYMGGIWGVSGGYPGGAGGGPGPGPGGGPPGTPGKSAPEVWGEFPPKNRRPARQSGKTYTAGPPLFGGG